MLTRLKDQVEKLELHMVHMVMLTDIPWMRAPYPCKFLRFKVLFPHQSRHLQRTSCVLVPIHVFLEPWCATCLLMVFQTASLSCSSQAILRGTIPVGLCGAPDHRPRLQCRPLHTSPAICNEQLTTARCLNVQAPLYLTLSAWESPQNEYLHILSEGSSCWYVSLIAGSRALTGSASLHQLLHSFRHRVKLSAPRKLSWQRS